MIEVKEAKRPLILLHTEHTTYAMKVMENGQIEHLYYGARIDIDSSEALTEHHAYTVGSSYGSGFSGISPEDTRYELSTTGKGDVREPMLEAEYEDGSRTLDPVYESHEITSGKPELPGLPSSYGSEEEVETLCIILKDRNGDLRLKLYYSVFPKRDVITRSLLLTNGGSGKIVLERVMSMQLDLDAADYSLQSFNGSWGREMKRTKIPIRAGKIINDTRTGNSSNRANPFLILSKGETGEDHGECYGLNLVYSGNHAGIAERSPYGKLRLMNGISPEGFRWILKPGETFAAPEAVLCYSDKGYGTLSRRLHAFIREHIVRGAWQHRERPVVLNSWEASYFDIDEEKLLRLARVAGSVGVEMFVMDDGWFGHRDDDTSSLGDWVPDPKKLPGGLQGLAEKIRALGMGFGLWVEPEMVSEDSRLYRAHPDWAMRHPKHDHSMGRNQMVLDFCNPEVQNNIIKQMKDAFSAAKIDYVKWDMNRNFSDVYSPYLSAECRGETAHRYILGLYRVLTELTKSFPGILFEGCASGGNRFDLGMLCYFPQIWASDDTDAIERVEIQNGYSYGYPANCISAHVSDVPNHQTFRRTPLSTRFAVAAAGVLGYECDLGKLDTDELEEIRSQIRLYKEWRGVLQFGDHYRGKIWTEASGMSVLDAGSGSDASWTVVSADKKKAVATELQLLARVNVHTLIHYPKGLEPSFIYHMAGWRYRCPFKEYRTSEAALPPSEGRTAETEEHIIGGLAAMRAGIHVKPAVCGPDGGDDRRFFPDFASRMYFYEAE